MAFKTHPVDIGATGEGSFSVAPGRLVALESGAGAGSAFWMTNRGKAYNIGDRLPDEEEFIAGRCVVKGGIPGSTVRVHFRF